MNNETDNVEKTTDQPLQFSALLCCPFCGGKAEQESFIVKVSKFDSVKQWKVSCNDCCASSFDDNSEAEAIAAWNKRET